jgi:hypothetical protein
MRINRIINTHFERPLFTIYTMASLSHKKEMRLEVHKCPHKTAATTTLQVPANLQSNVALKSTVSDLWQNVFSARTYQTYNAG